MHRANSLQFGLHRGSFASVIAAVSIAISACNGTDGGRVDEAKPQTPSFLPVKWENQVTRTPQAICYGFIAIDVQQLRPPGNDRVTLSLPCAASITVALDDYEDVAENQFIWHGSIETQGENKADNEDLVTFSVVGDALVGDITTSAGKMYSIRFLARGVNLIEELDPGKFPKEEAREPIEGNRTPQAPDTPVVVDDSVPPEVPTDNVDPATGLERDRSIGFEPDLAGIVSTPVIPAGGPKVNVASGVITPDATVLHAQPDPVAALMQSKPALGKAEGIETAPMGSESITIDVLVAYTGAAAAFQAGPSAILAKINQAIFQANKSYKRGDIGQRIKLAYAHPTEYEEKGSDYQDLRALKEDRLEDADLKQLDDLRTAHKADIVVLLTKPALENESCGRADQMQSVSESFCARAFAVVPVTCATSLYSFAHELGHLMGADHNAEAGLSGAPFAYSLGYIPPTNNWRTIMSYTTEECVAATCPRRLRWSNPLLYADIASAPEEPQPNNALALNNTATTVAKFSEACATNAE